MTTITWTAASSGDWNTASNWSGNQIPGAGDDALVNQPGAYLITVSGVTVNSVTLNDGAAAIAAAGAFHVNGAMVISAGTLAINTLVAVTLGSLSNSGTVVDNGTLTFQAGDIAALQGIGGKGTLIVDAAFDQFGTLDLAPLNSLTTTDLRGTITNGTILNADLSLRLGETLTLGDVLVGGTLGAQSGTVIVAGPLALAGPDGTGPASLRMSGDLLNPNDNPSVLHFDASQTLDNAVFQGGGVRIEVADTLTLGSGLDIWGQEVLHSASVQFFGVGTIVNNGTVDARGISAGIVVDESSFVNAGLMEVTPTSPVGTPSGFASMAIRSVTFDNTSSGHIDVTGGNLIASGTSLTNAGSISTGGDPLSSISFTGSAVANAIGGVITAVGGTIAFGAATALTNDGTIATTGGLIDIASVLNGAGAVTLAGNGTVEVETAAASSTAFDFTGAGTLVLVQPGFVAATINDFSSDDAIQLGVSATAVSYTDGDLKMQVGSGTIDLGVTGAHTLADFIFNTGTAGTTVQLACFAAGTRIRTERGCVPVEQLHEGDSVIVSGADNALPIVWIGQRTLECSRHPRPASVWPIRIAAGAFADQLPERDLYLSPDHAVFVDDVLIPVKYLINGNSIVPMQCEQVTYYHVELSRHAVLFAEGLTTESRLPSLDRSAFANGGPAIALHPDFDSHAWEADGCAPLVVTGPKLDVVRARLGSRVFDQALRRRA